MQGLVSIVIPTKNEEKNIGKLLQAIALNVTVPYEAIVVDDSNNNKTATVALANNATVLDGEKQCLAYAVKKGITRAKGQYIIVMDADLQHPPEMLSNIIEELKYHDLVVATKHTNRASAELNLWRKIQSQLGVIAARGLIPISDPMTGFFGIRKSCLDGIELETIGFKIGLEIFCKANWVSHSELPIEFRARVEGQSKGTSNSLHKHLWHLYKSSLKYRLPLPDGCDEWHAFYESNGWRKKWKQAIAHRLAEISKDLEPEKVIDVGCGSSPNINYLHGQKKYGVDIRKGAINFLSKRTDAILKYGSILNIPFSDNYFDLTCCIEVIEHMKGNEATKAISELVRITKTSGYVIIATPNYNSKLWKLIEKTQQVLQPGNWVDDHYTKLNRKLLKELCAQYNLKEIMYEEVAKGCDMIVTYQKIN